MLQVKLFKVAGLFNQVRAANEFLRTHKPAGEVARMGNHLFIAYETEDTPVEYRIAEYREMLEGNRQAVAQQEIAVHVLEYERANVDKSKHQNQYDEYTRAINNARHAIDIQIVKAAFVEQRIEDLKNGRSNNVPGEAYASEEAQTSAESAA